MADRVAVVLQSRLSSSRLPAKALLPLGGTTSVSLAAWRGANTGLPVVVATSEDASDDPLAKHLAQAGHAIFRGSLGDVLGRFVQATQDLADDDVVVRLTADNPFPDGSFIEELVRARAARGDAYLATRSPLDGLPLGLSAEAFTVAALRKAARSTTHSYDREHVTPWIERTYGTPIFRPASAVGNLAHLRCTLDTLSDYLRLVRVFEGVADPASVPALELVERLAKLDGEPTFRVPYRIVEGAAHGALALDVAGLDAEHLGSAEASAIVTNSVAHGVSSFVTSGASARALKRLGDALRGGLANQVDVSCVLHLAQLNSRSVAASEVAATVDAELLGVCHRLGVRLIGGAILNRSATQSDTRVASWDRLRTWESDGSVQRLGASVTSPDEALVALDDERVTQLYVVLAEGEESNVAWHAPALARRIAERPNLVVQVRSASFDALGVEAISRGEQRRELLKRLFELSWITSVIVSARSARQLAELLDLFHTALGGERR